MVLQCACSAAADMTPKNRGDPDHPNVSRKSITTRSPTVYQKLWTWSGSTGTFRKASDTSALLISIVSPRDFFSQWHKVVEKLGQRLGAQALGNGITVSVSVQPSCLLSALPREEKTIDYSYPVCYEDANRDTLRFRSSCAADFCSTTHF